MQVCEKLGANLASYHSQMMRAYMHTVFPLESVVAMS